MKEGESPAHHNDPTEVREEDLDSVTIFNSKVLNLSKFEYML